MGGLGNQMFAYSFAMALRNLGREVALDTTWYERNRAHNGWELDTIFELDIGECSREERDRLGDLDARFVSRLRRKLFGERRGHFKESGPGYCRDYLDMRGDAYFDGFWQSPRYHKGIEGEIEATFAFPADLEPEGRACLDRARGRSLVGVHVRRGDYLSSEALFGVCGEAYYRGAIEAILEGARDPLVLFFSDDLRWCEETISSGLDAVFVDWNRGDEAWRDMRLMTRCDRLVIANSSFSWWGARLGAAGRPVLAPSRWFGGTLPDNPEICLPGWIRMDSKGQR